MTPKIIPAQTCTLIEHPIVDRQIPPQVIGKYAGLERLERPERLGQQMDFLDVVCNMRFAVQSCYNGIVVVTIFV